MNYTKNYIGELKQVHNVTSDYAVAKLLQITTSQMSNYVTGRSTFSDEIAIKVADCLNIPAGIVLVHMQIERAERAEKKGIANAWTEAMKGLKSSMQGFILALAVFAGLAGSPTPVDASTGNDPEQCILCQIVYRYFKKAMQSLLRFFSNAFDEILI